MGALWLRRRTRTRCPALRSSPPSAACWTRSFRAQHRPRKRRRFDGALGGVVPAADGRRRMGRDRIARQEHDVTHAGRHRRRRRVLGDRRQVARVGHEEQLVDADERRRQIGRPRRSPRATSTCGASTAASAGSRARMRTFCFAARSRRTIEPPTSPVAPVTRIMSSPRVPLGWRRHACAASRPRYRDAEPRCPSNLVRPPRTGARHPSFARDPLQPG